MKRIGRKSTAQNDYIASDAPTIGTATDVPSGRAFNNGRADVTFTAPTTGNTNGITGYTVTSSPGGFTGTGATSPISVTGLQSNTAYTFTVTATNASGTSAASAASNSITATTVPATMSAPTVASTVNAQDVVSWTAPSSGGSAITGYIWASSDSKTNLAGGTPGTGPVATTSVTVAQEAGTAQTYTVYAINANGNGVVSSASASITTFFAPPAFFAPPSFFAPPGFIANWMGGCLDPETKILTPTGEVAAKDIKIGDVVLSWKINELPDTAENEGYNPYTWESETFSIDGTFVETTVTDIIPENKADRIWFNENVENKLTFNQPTFVKTAAGGIYKILRANNIVIGDTLINVDSNGNIQETLVESIDVDYEDNITEVYNYSCEPYDWYFAGGTLVHNK